MALGATLGDWLGGPAALLVAVLAWSRLRFRPSPEATIWRRQAAMQRRTAGLLAPLADEGYLLHDVTLPGWLGALEHVAVGPSGIWVIGSWQRRRRPLGGAAPMRTVRGLRLQADAVTEVLDGWARLPVRPLLCVHGAWPGTAPTFGGIRVSAPRRLAQVVRSGSPVAPGEVERATGRLLEVLRPAA